MKNILIIYPHWHPANLAGVHRPRLIGNFLPEFGWHPIVLTVKSEYFEEKPDPDFITTFRNHYEVYRVNAFKIGKVRLVGDIGLRAFFQLYKKAKELISEKKIDFIWIPIPSFYTSLLGRLLYNKTKIPYGIDYIDPWVRDITNQKSMRAVISQFIARNLEPFAVKKAAVISGVSTPYYQPVLNRNFKKEPIHVGMPYGFDPLDHQIKLQNISYPWGDKNNIKPWVYAGAFLPNSHLFLDSFFGAVSKLRLAGQWDSQIRLYFLGTGMYPAKRITSYAKDHGIGDIVFEERARYPFLHILSFLNDADRVMLFGSTEKHYTASKTFQCLLSHTPLFSMLHESSSAYEIIKETKVDEFSFAYKDSYLKNDIVEALLPMLVSFIKITNWEVNLQPLDKYSAKESARKLVNCIEKVVYNP